MKVELEKLRMGHSPLTDHIFVGTIIKEGVWRNKVDLTNDFIGCVIARWEGHKEVISAGDQKWEITVKKIKQ
jgi:hypothetical protein